MGLRSKAVHFVTDLTTVLLNPISDKPSNSNPNPHPNLHDMGSPETEDSEDCGTENGPDTSSFSAFVLSLLTYSESDSHFADGSEDNHPEMGIVGTGSGIEENGGMKSFLTRGRETLGRVMNQAARISGYKQSSESKPIFSTTNDSELVEHELRPYNVTKEVSSQFDLPDISEPSLLLSENLRAAIYFSLPDLARGRNWVLLYSSWRHGISLLTLYRRSLLCPGYSLLVVGDKRGAVFGGLVEAPLQPTNTRKYQGTNSSFVFTDRSGHPVLFPPTGANRYFTLCSNDFLALGGGGHFALYLDGDLLNGSSSASETFGNSCLAQSEDFVVKEVELWGFVYASKYDETIAMCRTERSGICRW